MEALRRQLAAHVDRPNEQHDDETRAVFDAFLDALTAGPPPDDPAEDVLWVGTILALVAQGLESAAIEQDGPPSGEPDGVSPGTIQNT